MFVPTLVVSVGVCRTSESVESREVTTGQSVTIGPGPGQPGLALTGWQGSHCGTVKRSGSETVRQSDSETVRQWDSWTVGQ